MSGGVLLLPAAAALYLSLTAWACWRLVASPPRPPAPERSRLWDGVLAVAATVGAGLMVRALAMQLFGG